MRPSSDFGISTGLDIYMPAQLLGLYHSTQLHGLNDDGRVWNKDPKKHRNVIGEASLVHQHGSTLLCLTLVVSMRFL